MVTAESRRITLLTSCEAGTGMGNAKLSLRQRCCYEYMGTERMNIGAERTAGRAEAPSGAAEPTGHRDDCAGRAASLYSPRVDRSRGEDLVDEFGVLGHCAQRSSNGCSEHEEKTTKIVVFDGCGGTLACW